MAKPGGRRGRVTCQTVDDSGVGEAGLKAMERIADLIDSGDNARGSTQEQII